MNLFTPPTDSLHKFCALTGLVIVILACYIPYQKYEELISKAHAALLSSQRAEVELDYLRKDLSLYWQFLDNAENMLKQLVDIAEKRMKLIIENAESRMELRESEGKLMPGISAQEIKERVSTLHQAAKDLEIKGVEARAALDELRWLRKRLWAVYIVGVIGLIVGASLAVYGFRNWYRRIQVYQDAVAKREAEKNVI